MPMFQVEVPSNIKAMEVESSFITHSSTQNIPFSIFRQYATTSQSAFSAGVNKDPLD